MKKSDAFIVGLFAVSFAVTIGAKIFGAWNPLEVGALYFALSGGGGLVGIAKAKRQRSYDAWTARTMFMLPFFPFFLLPLLFACGAIVYEWKQESPMIHYTGIILGFLISTPSFLFFIWLSDLTSKKPNQQSPRTTR